MAAAFTLTMAYLAEHCIAEDTASALAAYITGVVASNLVGRLVSASVADLCSSESSALTAGRAHPGQNGTHHCIPPYLHSPSNRRPAILV